MLSSLPFGPEGIWLAFRVYAPFSRLIGSRLARLGVAAGTSPRGTTTSRTTSKTRPPPAGSTPVPGGGARAGQLKKPRRRSKSLRRRQSEPCAGRHSEEPLERNPTTEAPKRKKK
eukprot:658870-Pyramimonas_sp.AAC.1